MLNPQSNTISIAGDWNNLVGLAAFTEGSSRVIFNGTADQYCNYTETFNILEVNKASGNFCMNSSSAVVTCAQYDWTAGGIKIIAGTFTANDLADLGIYGFISAENAATINLTNNDSYVDLNGSLAIAGSSTVNIYGGTTQSDWSLRANASLTMSGGTLDFKNQGIQIFNSTTYTFSSNITGGTIRTIGGFQANRTGFNPTGGILELYGSTDASLAMSYGSLYNLYINKAASREEANLPQAPLMAMDKEGNTRELTRSNTINLGSTIYINRDLIIQNGVFNASTQTINIGRDWNNQVGDAGFTQGQSTVIFDGLGTQYIYSDEVFWNFTLQKSGATSSLWQVDGTEVQVANTMNLISGYYRSGSDGDTYVKNLNIQSLACFSSLSELHVAGDMYDYNTTYGESVGYVQQGVLVFDGDTDQTISRSGTEISANSLIIYKSSSTRCYFEKPVTLSNSLSIRSGIWQDMGNGFVHKVGGVVTVNGTGSIANDTNNTFSFVGNMAQTIAYYSSSMGFTNIVIDKSDSGRTVDSESKDGNRSVDVTMIFHINLANSGNFTVENGNFYTNGLNLTCPGNININSSNAALYIMPGSTVRLGNTKSLNVNAGLLDISGSTTRTTTIT
ncbi:MAG: hypothetical protein PHO32_00370, partial [Candidatus Cloacimonetes bacterium]|nr:hypothetical protein [Candidatus Cloacimonadota bacterium]